MSIHSQLGQPLRENYLSEYLEALALVERLHRLLLDVIKDEFERVGLIEINPVQALLLFNIGENEVTAGELRSRGYYQGSNVSYNLKKLVELGYMHHQRCEIDRRSVRVRLTKKGRDIRTLVEKLFGHHAEVMEDKAVVSMSTLTELTMTLRRIERFWTDQIRYIY
ncbi:MAG: MarR family transcriptional regulator [Roseivivax sp.]|nr:MarR family transcriptional regulator [Roseivivax sp.]